MRCQFSSFCQAERISRTPQLCFCHFIERAGSSNPGLAHARGTFRVGCNPPAQSRNPHSKAFCYRSLRFASTQPVTQSIDTERINGLCCCCHRLVKLSAHRATGIDLHLLGVAVRCRSRSGLRMPQEIQHTFPAALAVGFNNDAGSIGCGRAAGLDTSPFRYVAAARER